MSNTNFTEFQRVALKNYAGGDFAYILDMNQAEADDALEQCGDSLFRFIMTELGPAEDCPDADTAIKRMNNAASDILYVKSFLEDQT